jgi:hypothetical protein
MDWFELGAVPPKSLATTRLLLHWAAQIPSAAGATLPARADSSQTSLSWNDERALVSAPIGGMHADLRFADLHLIAGPDSIPLAGKTIAQGLEWLGERFERTLTRPVHELPDHPVAHGAPFSFSGDDEKNAAELALWFDNARAILDAVFKVRAHATPVRCWPHHFDIATLLDHGERSVGVGLSPGDASYDEPYFYVTAWPHPEGATLQPLEIGTWHTKGWTGAVLTATKLLASSSQSQQAAVMGFIDAAIDSCLELLGASGR